MMGPDGGASNESQEVVPFIDNTLLQNSRRGQLGDKFLFRRNKEDEIFPGEDDKDVPIQRPDKVEGQFVELPDLQGKELVVPLSLIDPNPSQQRSLFDPEKMRVLQNQIKDMGGQKTAINVNAYVAQNGQTRLVIIEGERRYQALRNIDSKVALVKIEFIPDEAIMRLHSLMHNDTKVAHNPIESARSYRDTIELIIKGKGVTDKEREFFGFHKDINFLIDREKAIEILAYKLGGENQRSIKKYVKRIKDALKLLNYPREVQNLIATEKISPATVAAAKRKSKEFEDPNRVFLEICRTAVRLASQNEKVDVVTPTVFATAITKIMGQHGKAAIDALERGKNLLKKFRGGIKSALNAVLDFSKSESINIEALRKLSESGETIESLRDDIVELAAKLEEVRILCEKAINPDPLEIPEGKPKFYDHINKSSKKNPNIFGNQSRRDMALEIAKVTDNNGATIFSMDLAKILKVGPNDIANNIRFLNRELAIIGLKLETWTMRRKSAEGTKKEGKYEQYITYRLNWLTPEELAATKEKTPKTAPKEDPRSTPASKPSVAKTDKKEAPKKAPITKPVTTPKAAPAPKPAPTPVSAPAPKPTPTPNPTPAPKTKPGPTPKPAPAPKTATEQAASKPVAQPSKSAQTPKEKKKAKKPQGLRPSEMMPSSPTIRPKDKTTGELQKVSPVPPADAKLSAWIEKYRSAFKDETRLVMAMEMAKFVTGKFSQAIGMDELAESLYTGPNELRNHLDKLRAELSSIYIELHTESGPTKHDKKKYYLSFASSDKTTAKADTEKSNINSSQKSRKCTIKNPNDPYNGKEGIALLKEHPKYKQFLNLVLTAGEIRKMDFNGKALVVFDIDGHQTPRIIDVKDLEYSD